MRLALFTNVPFLFAPSERGRANVQGGGMRGWRHVSGRSDGFHDQIRHRPTDEGWDRLTVAQGQIVALVCEALTNDEIGERLAISPRTVQRHLYEIFRKLGVSSRVSLAVAAVRREVREKCPICGYRSFQDGPTPPQEGTGPQRISNSLSRERRTP